MYSNFDFIVTPDYLCFLYPLTNYSLGNSTLPKWISVRVEEMDKNQRPLGTIMWQKTGKLDDLKMYVLVRDKNECSGTAEVAQTLASLGPNWQSRA